MAGETARVAKGVGAIHKREYIDCVVCSRPVEAHLGRCPYCDEEQPRDGLAKKRMSAILILCGLALSWLVLASALDAKGDSGELPGGLTLMRSLAFLVVLPRLATFDNGRLIKPAVWLGLSCLMAIHLLSEVASSVYILLGKHGFWVLGLFAMGSALHDYPSFPATPSARKDRWRIELLPLFKLMAGLSLLFGAGVWLAGFSGALLGCASGVFVLAALLERFLAGRSRHRVYELLAAAALTGLLFVFSPALPGIALAAAAAELSGVASGLSLRARLIFWAGFLRFPF